MRKGTSVSVLGPPPEPRRQPTHPTNLGGPTGPEYCYLPAGESDYSTFVLITSSRIVLRFSTIPLHGR